jgi:peptidoglycan/LPS O-acetylase OafA/YrhL
LLPCCLDSLVIGATLAWFAYLQGGVRNIPGRVFAQLALGSVAVMGLLRLLHHYNAAPVLEVAISPGIEAVFFVTIIAAAARGVTGPIGRLLDNPFLQYTGRISYGLYLYHMFAGYVGGMIASQLGVAFPMQEGPLRFGLLCGLSYVAAILSAHFIEAPINDLKRHFSTNGPAPKSQDVLAPVPVAAA